MAGGVADGAAAGCGAKNLTILIRTTRKARGSLRMFEILCAAIAIAGLHLMGSASPGGPRHNSPDGP